MHCTRCGAEVSQSAKYCSGCGAGTAEIRPRGLAGFENPLAKMSGCSFVLLVIAGLWAASVFTASGDHPAPAIADPAAAETKAKACNAGLDRLTKSGLIKSRPQANEIDVNELAWAALSAKEKEYVVLGVRCSVLAGYDEASGSANLNDVTFVNGYHSGKELASAVKGSVTLD